MASPDSSKLQQKSLLQKEAIDRAHAAFSRLPKGDAIFQQCITQEETLIEVVESVLQKCQSHRKKKSSWLLQKFQRHTLWLQNMGSVMDVAVQAQAGIGCPVWAPIKLVLKVNDPWVSNDYSEAVEKILNLIQKIAECLPRFEIYEILQEDAVLQVALLNVFADVVEFSVRAAHFFQRGTLVRLGRIIGRTFDQELGDVVMRLERHACNVDQTAIAVELLKAAEHCKKAEQERRSDLMIQYERWLRPANTKEIHECQTRARLDQTCTWITTHESFKRWIDHQPSSPPDRFLCISGTHGCGKSVLASFIVSNLKAQQLLALFFAFSAVDSARSDAVDMVRTLTWQLLQRTTDNESLNIVCGLMLQGEPATSELWDIFGQIAARFASPVYCVIDGIDESTDCDKVAIERLNNLVRTCQNVHILLLGRPHATTALLHSATHNVKSIEVTYELISQDIEIFIESEVTKSDVLNLPEFRGRIIETLRAKSDCMFLWVKLMVNDLRKSSTRFELIRRLQDLPCGLENTYRLVFKRLIERLDSFDLRLVQSLLAFTIAACRPLTFEQFRYAYALETRSKIGAGGHTLEDFLLVQPKEHLLGLCGGLILMTEGSIRLVHSSIKDFLTRPSERWVCAADLVVQSFRVDISTVHRLFTSVSLDYLEIEGNSLTSREHSGIRSLEQCYSFLFYVLLYTCYHFNRSGSPDVAILEKIKTLFKSTQFVTWIEHYVVLLFEDPSLELQLHELELSRDTLSKTSVGQDLLNYLRDFLQRMLVSHRERNGPDDPRSQQWQLLLAAHVHDQIASDTDRLGDNQGDELIAEPGVANEKCIASSASPKVDGLKPYSAGLAKINQMLTRHDVFSTGRQIEIALRLQQCLKRFRYLTDPLEVLLRLILKNASIIPVHGLLVIADFYHRVSKYREAIEVSSVALKKIKHQNTPVNFRLHDLMVNCYRKLKNYNEALASACIAYTGFKTLFGDINHETIGASHNIAFCHFRLGEYKQALKRFKMCLAQYETTLGFTHESTLDTLFWTALCFLKLEKNNEALECFQRCLAKYETTLGSTHKLTLDALYWTAVCFYNLEKNNEALEYFQRCLAKDESLYASGKDFDAWRLLDRIQKCYYKQAKYQEQLEFLENLLNRVKSLGKEHLTITCHILAHKGVSYNKLERFEEAAECFEALLTEEKARAEEGRQDGIQFEWILSWIAWSKAGLQPYQTTETEDESWTGQAEQVCQDLNAESCVQEQSNIQSFKALRLNDH